MTQTKQTLIVQEQDHHKRVDIFLAEHLNISRSKVQKLIRNGSVLINGNIVEKISYKVKQDSEVVVDQPAVSYVRSTKEAHPLQKADISIIEQTEDYLIVYKPAGVLTHPTEAGEPNTLAAWLIENYSELKGVGEHPDRPGIVHRLDKDVSGLLVIAKNQKMYEQLKDQFKNRTVEKNYAALVYGSLPVDEGVIDFPLARGTEGRMVARPIVREVTLKTVGKTQEGKEAITEFIVKARYARFSLLEVKILTGRTHQIRVHLFAYNHPVVGDSLYFQKNLIKKSDKDLGRMFLHATKLCFSDLDGNKVCFDSELPKELQDYLKDLK